jgi:hypothetical protein
MTLLTDPNEPEILSQSGTATGELEVQHQLAIGDPLDDGAIVRAGSRRFVPAPDPAPHRIDSPPSALPIPALRRIARSHRVLVRAVGIVPRRDHDFARPELTRRRPCRLPVPLEEPLSGIGQVAPKLVKGERVESPRPHELCPRVTAPGQRCAAGESGHRAGKSQDPSGVSRGVDCHAARSSPGMTARGRSGSHRGSEYRVRLAGRQSRIATPSAPRQSPEPFRRGAPGRRVSRAGRAREVKATAGRCCHSSSTSLLRPERYVEKWADRSLIHLRASVGSVPAAAFDGSASGAVAAGHRDGGKDHDGDDRPFDVADRRDSPRLRGVDRCHIRTR